MGFLVVCHHGQTVPLLDEATPPHDIGPGLFVEADEGISASTVGGFQRINQSSNKGAAGSNHYSSIMQYTNE